MSEDKAKLPLSESGRFNGQIRLLQERDLLALRPILETWVRSRQTGELLPEEVEEDLHIMMESCSRRNDRTYFVAEEPDGRVIGVIGMTSPSESMRRFTTTSNPVELVNAYVAREQRQGRGVGRALVGALENEAISRGFTEIVLNSGPRYKDSGWGFYDRLEGFNRVGVAEKLYGEGGDAPVWHKIFESVSLQGRKESTYVKTPADRSNPQ